MKHTSHWVAKVYSQIVCFIFENTKVHGVCRKTTINQDFLVKEWSVEGCVTKGIE